MNVLWEMAAAERVLHGVLEGARGLIHGVTCGAGMPYRIAEICARYGVHYYPIVSSARAFRALWKRAYHKFRDWLGGVVYEDPWLAGGHNGMSNSEDPEQPEAPYPRVRELRRLMSEFGLAETPIFMAGGVWYLREWSDWIDNPELGPVAFQFGTRPLLTQESPISDAWKRKLLTLQRGRRLPQPVQPDRLLFLGGAQRLSARSCSSAPSIRSPMRSSRSASMSRRSMSARAAALVYLTPHDRESARALGCRGLYRGVAHTGFDADLRHAGKGARDPHRPDQLHGLPQRLPVLELGAERARHDRQEGRPAQLLHPEDIAGDPPLRRRRVPADVRRTQRLSLRVATRSTRTAMCRPSRSWSSACRPAIDRGHSPIAPLYFPKPPPISLSMELPPTCPNVVERLRAAGLRPTRQRLALARLLFDGGDRHVTAEQLHGEAQARRDPGLAGDRLQHAAPIHRRRAVARGRRRARTVVFRHERRRPPSLLLRIDGSSAGHPRRAGHGRAVAAAARGRRDPSRRCDHPHPPRSCDTSSLKIRIVLKTVDFAFREPLYITVGIRRPGA